MISDLLLLLVSLCLYRPFSGPGRFAILNPIYSPWTGDQKRRRASIYARDNTNIHDLSRIPTHDTCFEREETVHAARPLQSELVNCREYEKSSLEYESEVLPS
jgi:hypothetical protein